MAEPLGPEDIENVTFPTSIRGYDRDSVDIFLQEVATAYEAALSEANAARSQKPYRSLGEEMGDLLQHAKDSAEETKRAAEAEALLLRDQATQNAGEALSSAEAEAKRIREGAEREAAERIQDAAETVAQLETMDKEAREELRTLRMRLDSVVAQLRSLEPQDLPPSMTDSEDDAPPASPATEPISLVPESVGSDGHTSNSHDERDL